MATVPIYVVEAFTVDNNTPYTGNPAAVCILQYDDDISDESKQKIANTMNVSDTAFVALDWTKAGQLQNNSTEKGVIRRTLRWFTPITEAPVCGHATVASTKVILAHLLNETNEKQVDAGESKNNSENTVKKIEYQSKFCGLLTAELTPASQFEENLGNSEIRDRDDFITLNFPANPTTKVDLESNSKPNYWLIDFTRDVLGPSFPFEGKNVSEVVEDVQVVLEHSFLLFRLKPRANEPPEVTLRKVRPNFVKLLEPTGDDDLNIGVPHAVIVTIKGHYPGKGPDFYSRFFGPFFGVDEDPVTGWAHTVLTPYWTEQLAPSAGQDSLPVLRARQASTRGGDLWCQLQGQGQLEGQKAEPNQVDNENANGLRVYMSGRARIVLKGNINV